MANKMKAEKTKLSMVVACLRSPTLAATTSSCKLHAVGFNSQLQVLHEFSIFEAPEIFNR